MACVISSSSTTTSSSTVLRVTRGRVSLPGVPTAMPSATVAFPRTVRRRSGLVGVDKGGGGLGLHADHFDAGERLLYR